MLVVANVFRLVYSHSPTRFVVAFRQRLQFSLGRSLVAIGLFGAAIAIARLRVSLFDWHYRPLILAGSGMAIAASLGVLFRRSRWLLVGAMIGVAPVLWHFRDLISSALPL
jgi:hypothetical protein